MTEQENTTRRERIYRELVAMIISGELSMGDPIEEKILIDRLSVSRTPFREAIGILEKQGLVEIRPYRGFTVRRFSKKEIADLYDLRSVLEAFAIRLAVANLRNVDIPRFEQILNSAVEALTRGDMVSYAAFDREFHQTIAHLSGNNSLIEALETLSLQIQMCRVVANQGEDFPARAAKERDEILRALRQRDAERASNLMSEHILDVRKAVLAWLEKERPEDGVSETSGRRKGKA